MIIETDDVHEMRIRTADGKELTIYFTSASDKEIFIDELNKLIHVAYG